MKDDTVSRASVLKAIDEYERLSAVSQTVRNMTSLREIVKQLPSVQTCDDAVSRADVIELVKDSYYNLAESMEDTWAMVADVEKLPAVQPQTEWNNHTVACLLAELFGDACACNYNGIDEWLPEKCEVIDACPNPVGVACWEQFLKHRAERRTE